jgi:hypothetical protein
MRLRIGRPLQQIAVLVDVADDDVIGRWTFRQAELRLDDGPIAVLNEVEDCQPAQLLGKQKAALRAKELDLEIAREQRKLVEAEIKGFERRRSTGQDA